MSHINYDFPLFTGDTDENTNSDTKTDTPIQWLGKLERTFDPKATETDKLHLFKVNLERGSTAREWWDNVPATDRDTWDKVVDLFEKQWPSAKPLATGTTAKKALLLNLRLDESKLGEMEGTGRNENYTHIRWAERAYQLWKGLNDPSGHLLDQVRPNLPKALLDATTLAASDRNNGEKFFEAVRLVDVERMMQRVEELRKIRELEERIGALSLPSQYTTSLTSAMGQYYQPAYYPQPQQQTPQPMYTPPHRRGPTPQSPAPHQAQQTSTPQPTPRANPPHMPTTPLQQGYLPTPTNSSLGTPFTDQTTPRPNNFFRNLTGAQTPASPPAGRTPDSYDLARRAAADAVPFPDTEEGITSYKRAYEGWIARWGPDSLCTFHTWSLPLSPGTAVLGSRECYTCGRVTTPPHLAQDCGVPEHQRIPIKEKQWRTYINNTLWGFGQRSSVTTPRRSSPGIAQIAVTVDGFAYDPSIYPAESLEFEEGTSSGNGLESHN